MKVGHARFASLMATGAYTMTQAHREVWGEKKGTKNGQGGSALMKRTDVMHRIADLQQQFNLRVGVNAEWIRGQLVNSIVHDTGDKMKAIDTINKMNGYYEKDNEQKKQAITLEMQF